MKLIVGLGNPGEKYHDTRHNVGFVVVEHLAHDLADSGVWPEDKRLNAQIFRQDGIILLKPLTFMNLSGRPVGKVARFYHLAPQDIMVIHDDIDLPLGKIKIKQSSTSAGHHGVESINQELGSEDYWRLRMGIGHPGRGDDGLVEKFVLEKFMAEEHDEVEQMVKQAVLLAKDWLQAK